MTHTLHRSGSEESLRNDFVVFAMAAQTVNAKGIAPEFKVFESIVKKYNPVNYGDMKTGNVFMVDLGDIGKSYCDSSIAHAVFTDEVTVGKVLNELAAANLKLSIIVSGLLEQVAQCCHDNQLVPHTVEYSLGIWGRRELLPSKEVLEIATMCGHGMISFSLIEGMSREIAKGRLTAEQAAEKLARLCHCGVFNPVRAARILQIMAEQKTNLIPNDVDV
jgi:hypothetical protein